MIPESQLKAVKEKIISLLDPKLPKAQKDDAIKQINSMSSEQLEAFLKQNKISPEGKSTISSDSKQPEGCIFCAISQSQVESYKLDENKHAVAVLELNPLSPGHSLVIPKKHVSDSGDVPSQAFALTKKMSKKLKTKLPKKPETVQISNSNMFGHEVIQVIPIYKDTPMAQGDERKPAPKDELFKLQKLLEKKPRKKTTKRPKTKKLDSKDPKSKIKIPRRIP